MLCDDIITMDYCDVTLPHVHKSQSFQSVSTTFLAIVVLWRWAGSIINSRTFLALLGSSQELVQTKNVLLFIFLKLDGTLTTPATAVSAWKLLIRNKSTIATKISLAFHMFKLTLWKLHEVRLRREMQQHANNRKMAPNNVFKNSMESNFIPLLSISIVLLLEIRRKLWPHIKQSDNKCQTHKL